MGWFQSTETNPKHTDIWGSFNGSFFRQMPGRSAEFGKTILSNSADHLDQDLPNSQIFLVPRLREFSKKKLSLKARILPNSKDLRFFSFLPNRVYWVETLVAFTICFAKFLTVTCRNRKKDRVFFEFFAKNKILETLVAFTICLFVRLPTRFLSFWLQKQDSRDLGCAYDFLRLFDAYLPNS